MTTVSDPQIVFSAQIHNLAQEALEREMTGEELVRELLANPQERWKAKKTTRHMLEVAIEKANPSFDAAIDVVDDNEPMPNGTVKALIGDITSPSQLKAMLDKQYGSYVDQLLAHYIDAKKAELVAAAA